MRIAPRFLFALIKSSVNSATVLRNLGVPLGHTLIAMQSMIKGLGKLIVNEPAIRADLERNWAVVAEAIQSILRRENYPKPYEALLELTRTNKRVTEETIREFIQGLAVSVEIKEELMKITPWNYTVL